MTPIETAGAFYPAEDYQQDDDRKAPVRYTIDRDGCRRDARVSDLWGEEAHRGIERE